MNEPTALKLEGLFDTARLARELGISRSAAERIMQQVPKQVVPGLRKNFARGGDIAQFLDEHVRDV